MEIPLTIQNSGILVTDQGTSFLAYDLTDAIGRYVTISGSGAFRVIPDDQGSVAPTENAGGAHPQTFAANTATPADANNVLTHLVDGTEPFLWIAADAAATVIRINATSARAI